MSTKDAALLLDLITLHALLYVGVHLLPASLHLQLLSRYPRALQVPSLWVGVGRLSTHTFSSTPACPPPVLRPLAAHQALSRLGASAGHHGQSHAKTGPTQESVVRYRGYVALPEWPNLEPMAAVMGGNINKGAHLCPDSQPLSAKSSDTPPSAPLR